MNFIVNNINYKVIKLLGKGKGGYSYLCLSNSHYFVIKKLHHEPCDYYKFSNKFESEINSYNKLLELNIKIPKMYDADSEQEIIVKEYIEGNTIDYYVSNNLMKDKYLDQVKEMQKIVSAKNINLDYFPTNFVVNNDSLFYIDYEINEYMDKWNFENWGKLYWSLTPEFKKHFKIK